MQTVDLMILGDKALLMDENHTCLPDAAIAVDGSSIIDIGSKDDLSARYQAKKTLCAEGSLIMPGLVNCHTHAAMNLLRGFGDDMPLMDWLTKKIWPAEAKLTPEEIFNGTKAGCEEMAASGTTSFNDMYFYPEDQVKAALESRMRDFAGIIALAGGKFNFTPEYVERTFEELKSQSNGLIKLVVSPHSIYAAPEKTLVWCADFARKNKLLLHIHLSETEREVDDCLKQHNCQPVEYLEKIGFLGPNVIAAHGCWLSDEEIKILAERKVNVVNCPTSNLKLASGVMPFSKLTKAGVNVCLGTDGSASNNNLDMVSEMKIAALIHKWNERDPESACAQAVLDMATINGAKALGMSAEIGSLEPGKKADIVLLDFNQPHLQPCFSPVSNLVYAACGRDVVLTMVNGKTVFQHSAAL